MRTSILNTATTEQMGYVFFFFRLHQIYNQIFINIRLHIGVVSSEAAVENTTSFTENSSSQSYLEASIVVVAPAGIAARSTLTPLTRLSICSIQHGINTQNGIMIKRITL
mgnify:CR=1 FL=1